MLLLASVASSLMLGKHVGAATILQNEQAMKASKLIFLIKTVTGGNHRHKAKFKVGEKIAIEMLVKNNAGVDMSLLTTDPYFQYRLQLLRDNDPSVVPLRNDISELVAEREEGPGPGKRLMVDPLPSSDSRALGTLDLQDWYGQLEPGKYRLTVRYRPDTKGSRFSSNTVTFEVVP